MVYRGDPHLEMGSGPGLRPRMKPQSGSQAPDKPKGTNSEESAYIERSVVRRRPQGSQTFICGHRLPADC